MFWKTFLLLSVYLVAHLHFRISVCFALYVSSFVLHMKEQNFLFNLQNKLSLDTTMTTRVLYVMIQKIDVLASSFLRPFPSTPFHLHFISLEYHIFSSSPTLFILHCHHYHHHHLHHLTPSTTSISTTNASTTSESLCPTTKATTTAHQFVILLHCWLLHKVTLYLPHLCDRHTTWAGIGLMGLVDLLSTSKGHE